MIIKIQWWKEKKAIQIILSIFNESWKMRNQWGDFYLLIANFFATYNIDGAKELVVLLWLSGDI